MQARTGTEPERGLKAGDPVAFLQTCPAIFRQPRFSTAKINAVVDALAEHGIDARRAVAGSGIDVSRLHDPTYQTSSAAFVIVANNALTLCNAPDLAISVGRRLRVSSYGIYGYALLCADTLRNAFTMAVRYHQIANGVMEIGWREDGARASWEFPARLSYLLQYTKGRLYWFLIALQYVVHVTIIKDVMGTACAPVSASFAQAETQELHALAAFLGCPVAFSAPVNSLDYETHWLDHAPQLANPLTAAQTSAYCARLVEEIESNPGVARRVYQELTRAPGVFPDLETIAERLCMTTRTLRRKLEAEDTSYRALLAGVRKALAIDYLRTTALTDDDIAVVLGFSDVVSFRHAFKRWTGQTATSFRN